MSRLGILSGLVAAPVFYGVWTERASTNMESAAPGTVPPPGGTAYRTIMTAWGGACLDTVNNQLLVCGGGHSDYSGNEIYKLPLATFVWALGRNPCSNAIIEASGGIESSGYYATDAGGLTADTQQPRSRHTYLNIQFVSGLGMVLFGGHGIYPTGNSDNNVDIWAPGANTWSQQTGVTGVAHPKDITGIDSSTGLIWSYGNVSNGFLKAYNPATGVQTDHGTSAQGNQALAGSPLDYQYMGGACVPGLWLYGIGKGKVYRWDISSNAAGTLNAIEITTTGPQTAQDSAGAIGLCYHPNGKLYAWLGGTAVYSLNVTTHAWAAVSIDVTNTVTPSAAQGNGTYGRFQYSSTSGFFVAVNATNQNVYTFKLNNA